VVAFLQRGGQPHHRRTAAHHPARSAVSARPSRPLSTRSQMRKKNRTRTRIQIRNPHRYGIRAFDTAPWYDNSETVLGTALKALEREFPRAAYQLLTKVGRYGPGGGAGDFDYSPDAIRRSVRRSLQRLHAQYLDVVYLHDIEFVVPCIAPRAEGNHAGALGAEAAAYGVAPACGSDEAREGTGTVRTPDDDERVLHAIQTLRALQADGLIRHIGICGPSRLLFSFSFSSPPPPHSTHRHRDRRQACPSQRSSAPRSSSSSTQAAP
jgi:aryl-alcohol dehydrogenase-like predicted oxidoreductase